MAWPKFPCTVLMSSPALIEATAKLCPYGIIRTHRIGKNKKNGRRYIYLDYEPWPDARSIPFRRPATYPEIRAWVLREYGLTVNDKHVAQVKRKHGILTKIGRSKIDLSAMGSMAHVPVSLPRGPADFMDKKYSTG